MSTKAIAEPIMLYDCFVATPPTEPRTKRSSPMRPSSSGRTMRTKDIAEPIEPQRFISVEKPPTETRTQRPQTSPILASRYYRRADGSVVDVGRVESGSAMEIQEAPSISSSVSGGFSAGLSPTPLLDFLWGTPTLSNGSSRRRSRSVCFAPSIVILFDPTTAISVI
eukprot:CAMPEP_0183419118 /NCGR_PEP_ID=MMETSP0370-20130417/25571_1 /TAXON_ID=268820 /ORGANISM="Peridinium aciculiferum, Strain PAER-2" /LENGTH=166 /DNA_ID=CAMNT_0025602893 /DNA_START=67 /DNA_END=567 /DNA_ORIENTATION=-